MARTTVRRFRQDSFAKGEIGPTSRGKKNSELFAKGADHLENWDILDEEILQVRGGWSSEHKDPEIVTVDSSRFDLGAMRVADSTVVWTEETGAIQLALISGFSTELPDNRVPGDRVDPIVSSLAPMYLLKIQVQRERTPDQRPFTSVFQGADAGVVADPLAKSSDAILLRDAVDLRGSRVVKVGPGQYMLLVGGLPIWKILVRSSVSFGVQSRIEVVPHGFSPIGSEDKVWVSPSDYPFAPFKFNSRSVRLSPIQRGSVVPQVRAAPVRIAGPLFAAPDLPAVGLTGTLRNVTVAGQTNPVLSYATYNWEDPVTGDVRHKMALISSDDADNVDARLLSDMPQVPRGFHRTGNTGDTGLDDLDEATYPVTNYRNRDPQYLKLWSQVNAAGGALSGAVGGSDICRQFPFFVMGYLPEDVLARVEQVPGMGGPLMLQLVLPAQPDDVSTRLAQLGEGYRPGERRDLFCWVFPAPGVDAATGSNCLICFSFRGGWGETTDSEGVAVETGYSFLGDTHPGPDQSIVGRGHPLWFYSFYSVTEAALALVSGLASFIYSVPDWNVADGFPRSGYSLGGRVFLGGGSKSNYVAASAPPPQSQFKFNTNIPVIAMPDDTNPRVLFTAEVLKSIRESANPLQTLRNMTDLLPNPLDGEEAVYWYILQSLGVQGITPHSGYFDLAPNDTVQWINGVRDLLVGTEQGEFRIPVGQDLGQYFGTRAPQSFRGSGSSIVSQGDYALFFVGALKRDIWALFYDDAVAGMRSRVITRHAPEFDSDVRDLIWDDVGKCLWVMLESGKVFKYFSFQEYEIEGWSRVTGFERTVGTEIRTLVPRHFYSVTGVASREMGPSKRIGIICREDVGAQSEYVPIEFERSYPRDSHSPIFGVATERPITAVANLFRVAPAGQQGESSSNWKRIGETFLQMRNTVEVYLGEARHRRAWAGDSEGEMEVTTSVTTGKLPTLRVEHSRPEKAQILAVSSRMEVAE